MISSFLMCLSICALQTQALFSQRSATKHVKNSVYKSECYEVFEVDELRNIRGEDFQIFGYRVFEINSSEIEHPYILSEFTYPVVLASETQKREIGKRLLRDAIATAEQCEPIDLNKYYENPLVENSIEPTFKESDSYKILASTDCGDIYYYESILSHNDTNYVMMNVGYDAQLEGWQYPKTGLLNKEIDIILKGVVSNHLTKIVCKKIERPFLESFPSKERQMKMYSFNEVQQDSRNYHSKNDRHLQLTHIIGRTSLTKQKKRFNILAGEVLYFSGCVKSKNSYIINSDSFEILIGGNEAKIRAVVIKNSDFSIKTY